MPSPRAPSPDDSVRADREPLYSSDTQTLHHADSQENASRLMDDLELLQAERIASNREREEAAGGRPRSKSVHQRNRHHPVAEPEDEFHTLTEPHIPQVAPPPETNPVGKLFKRVRKFPRIIRYFLYVSTIPRLYARRGLTMNYTGHTRSSSAVDAHPLGSVRLPR